MVLRTGLLGVVLTFAGSSAGITSVWNAASRAPGPLAPRSLVIISGSGLQVVTRAVITAGEREWPLSLLDVSDREILALVPEDLPRGPGALRLIGQNATFVPVDVVIADNNLGLFTQSRTGSGPAAAQNNGKLNTPGNPAVPAQLLTLWATGMGRHAEDLEIYVGTHRSRIVYAGPAGCCAGMDQIIVEVPIAAEIGCAVPVAATRSRRTSNFAWIAVSLDGTTTDCVDPLTFDRRNIPPGTIVGAIRTSRVTSIERVELLITGGSTLEAIIRQSLEAITVGFWRMAASSEETSGVPALGTCLAGVIAPSAVGPPPASPDALDAGPRIIATNGEREVELLLNAFGSYTLTQRLAEPVPGLPGASTAGAPEFLIPGFVQLTGTGGRDVGELAATIDIPDAFTWTNEKQVSRIPADGPLTIQWMASRAVAHAQVVIRAINPQGYYFTCRHQPLSGQITIPEYVIQALPNAGAVLLTIEWVTAPRRLGGVAQIFAAHTDTVTKIFRASQ